MVDPPMIRQRYPGEFFLGFSRDALGLLVKAARDHGDACCFRVGPYRAYLLNHPDLVQDFFSQLQNFQKEPALQITRTVLGDGLLTSEGDYHKKQRQLIQPAFHRQRIASYASIMVEKALALSQKWREGQTLDINEEMMHLALSIVGKSLFGVNLEEEAAEIDEALGTAMAVFKEWMYRPFPTFWAQWPFPKTLRVRKARKSLDSKIFGMIARHRQRGVDNGDLLSMMLFTEDAGGPMTDEQVRDEAMTLLLAGHETVGNALTYTWYLLSQNPEAEARLHTELDSVLGGRSPTLEDVPKLPYTEMVFAESMRLLPPAWALGYLALRDVRIGGYDIPKGAVVNVVQYLLHRDPRFWEEPEKFKPERFSPEAKAGRPRFAYFPFGGGSRQCIGESFAWMEGVLALATLARHWAPRPVAGYKLELFPSITMRPKHGMPMVLHRCS